MCISPYAVEANWPSSLPMQIMPSRRKAAPKEQGLHIQRNTASLFYLCIFVTYLKDRLRSPVCSFSTQLLEHPGLDLAKSRIPKQSESPRWVAKIQVFEPFLFLDFLICSGYQYFIRCIMYKHFLPSFGFLRFIQLEGMT